MERVLYLDVVKFIAILLVCIGHSYTITLGMESHLRDIIYSFHMPLFMLICGYFSENSFQLGIRAFLTKKGKQLLIPAFAGTLLSLSALTILKGGVTFFIIKQEAFGGFWFLKTLFACYLIVYVSKRIRLPDWALCIVSICIMFIIPWGGTLMINFLLIFFWTGFFMRKYSIIISRYHRCITLMSITLFVLAIVLGWAVPCEKIDIDLLINRPWILMRQYLVGLIGSFSVIGVSRFLCVDRDCGTMTTGFVEKVINGMAIIGRYTLGIYVVQTIVLEQIAGNSLTLFKQPYYNFGSDYVLSPLLGLFFCLLSYFIIKYTKRYKNIRILFYGGQK